MAARMNWADEINEPTIALSDVINEEINRKKQTREEGIIESLRRTYGLEISAPCKLFCNQESMLYIPSIDIPDMANYVTIEKDGDIYRWDLDIPEEISSHMSVTTMSKAAGRKEMSKIRHEFVAEAFQLGETDSKLSNYFPTVDDGQDILTPDFMFKDEGGIIHVIEIATTRAVDQSQIDKLIKDKLFKYENALFLRSTNNPVTLSVVAINHQGVYSTVPISSSLVDDLSIRYRVMIGLENVARSKGIDLFLSAQEEMLNETALSIKESIMTLQIEDNMKDDGVNITLNFISDCLSPVNQESVKEAFATSFKENPANVGRNWTKPADDNVNIDSDPYKKPEVSKYLPNFLESFQSKPESRTNKVKSVLNTPNIIPPRTQPSTQVLFKSIGSGGSDFTLIDIWKEAFKGVNGSESWKELSKADLKKEALETRQDLLKEIKERRKARMKTRARVSIKLNPGTERAIYLAKDGIKGKYSKNDMWRKIRKTEQSKSCDYNTSTLDIDDFLDSKELYEDHGRGPSKASEGVMKLIEAANDIASNKDDGIKIIENWSNTKMIEYAEFLSELSAELTVSLRQHTKRNELLLKKLRNFNCYLLIAPSGLKNPIGVSIMVPKTEDTIILRNFIGREMVETSTCYISKFVTFAPDKLENLYNIPGTIISLVSFLSFMYDVKLPTVIECCQILEFTKMLNFLVAIRLEDKAETEESITQTRYMYMEAMRTTAPIVPPEPLKVLSKISNKPRSRLNLWVIRKIVEVFTIMTLHPPKRLTVNDLKKDSEDEDPLPTDNWMGLINFITGIESPSATKLLNLFYIGYLKNKNALAQGNTNWALLEKTLNEELSVNWSDIEALSGNAPTTEVPKSHQFNLECVKAGIETLEKRLTQTYGMDWKNVIGDRILTKLSLHSTFSLATLKASSTTRDADIQKRMTKSHNPPIKRRKVLSAIIDEINMYGRNPFSKLHKFIQLRKKGSKKARTDLFKKQQHGGIREIFVMDEVTRPIQLFIETIARTICSEFEEESLTNPKRKLPIINNHFRKSKRYSSKTERQSINYNSSMDKTKWSQGFVIRVLSVALFRMTPDYFHGAIQQAMNMWIGKHVKIPPEVIEMLLNDVRLSSKSYQRLHAEFHGHFNPNKNEKRLLQSERCGFVSLQTGFMQGILHYSSSLLHLAFLNLCKSLISKIVTNTMPGCSVLISYACSSDDSAMMITLFLPEKSKMLDKRWIDCADTVEKLLHTLEIFCKFFCMRPSTKSTVAMLDSVEFNSEFIFNNTLAIPIIKFVAATQNMVPYESFIDKLQGHYNLLSDLFSAGMPAFNTHLCQIAQAMTHYKTLGLTISPLGEEISQSLLKVLEPGYGFFPLDSELCPGVMGFPFTQYMVSKRTGQMPISQKAVRREPLTIIESGSVSETLQVLHGDRKKQKKILLDIHDKKYKIKRHKSLLEDKQKYEELLDHILMKTREEVDKNYELFYRMAETDQELFLKLELKVLMPGVAKSLMSNNVFVQTVSVSLYSGHTDCITFTTERLNPNLVNSVTQQDKASKKSKVKLSLLAALKVKESELINQEDKGFDNENLRAICFPLYIRYEEALGVIQSFNNRAEIEVPRMRNQKNRIDIIPVRGRLPLTLLETVKAIWFGHTPRTSKTILRRCFDIYSGQYSWLKQSHDESLEASPFSTPSEMFGFLNSAGESIRTVTVVSPSLNSTKMTSQLNKLITKGYKACIILKKPKEKKGVKFNTRTLRNSLDLSLLIPIQEERKQKVKEILEGNQIVDEGVLEPSSLNKRDLALYIIQQYQKGQMDSMQIGELLRQTRIGYHLFYLLEQKKQINESGECRWVGPGEALLHIGDDFILLRLSDDKLTAIHVKDVATVSRNLQLLRKAIEEMGIRPHMDRRSVRSMIGKYNGDKVVNIASVGCPIFKDSTTKRVISDLEDIKVDINHSCLSLSHKVSSTLRSTLLKYTVRGSDIDTYSNHRVVSDFWKSWVQCDSWEFTKFRKTTMDLKQQLGTIDIKLNNWRIRDNDRNKLQQHKIDLVSYKEFMSMTLRYRLGQRKSLKINPEDYLSTIAETVADDTSDYLDDDMINELMIDAFGYESENNSEESQEKKENFDLFKNILDLDDDEVDAIEDAMEGYDAMLDNDMTRMTQLVVEKLGDTPLATIFTRRMALEFKGDHSELLHRPSNVYANHPLWDDLINTIENRDRRMLNNIMNGIVVGYDQELSRLLLWLLDIEEKQISDSLQRPDLAYEDPAVTRVRLFLESLGNNDSSSEEDE